MLCACPAVSVSVDRRSYNFILWACPGVSVSVVRISSHFVLWGCPAVSVSVVGISNNFDAMENCSETSDLQLLTRVCC